MILASSHLFETIDGVDHIDVRGKSAAIKVDAMVTNCQISCMSREFFKVSVVVAKFKTIFIEPMQRSRSNDGDLCAAEGDRLAKAGHVEHRERHTCCELAYRYFILAKNAHLNTPQNLV